MIVHAFEQSAPPHLRAKDSAGTLAWKTSSALFFVWALSLFYFPAAALRILVEALLGAMASELLGNSLSKRKPFALDPSTVLYALVFTLMMPASAPFGITALGAWAGLFWAKEIFGGLGGSVFHPALAGRLFLQVSFPQAFEGLRAEGWLGANPGLSLADLLIGHTQGALGEISAGALLAAGVLLILQRLIRAEVPLLYIASVFFLSSVVQTDPWHVLLSGRLLLVALFVVTDPVTTPLSPLAERLFSVTAGLLTVAIARMGITEAPFAAVMIVNLFSPWLDAWAKSTVFQPRPS